MVMPLCVPCILTERHSAPPRLLLPPPPAGGVPLGSSQLCKLQEALPFAPLRWGVDENAQQQCVLPPPSSFFTRPPSSSIPLSSPYNIPRHVPALLPDTPPALCLGASLTLACFFSYLIASTHVDAAGSPRTGSQTERGYLHHRGQGSPLGVNLPDLTARDIVKQSGASMERASELANWPSTNTIGSNSWLGKLEDLLNQKLQHVASQQGTIYDSAMVYHESFGYFIELFKTYQPFLARIHNGYHEVVKNGLNTQHRLEELQSDLFAAKKEAQEEMMRTVQDLKQRIFVLEKKVGSAESLKELAVAKMKEHQENFKQNQVRSKTVGLGRRPHPLRRGICLASSFKDRPRSKPTPLLVLAPVACREWTSNPQPLLNPKPNTDHR